MVVFANAGIRTKLYEFDESDLNVENGDREWPAVPRSVPAVNSLRHLRPRYLRYDGGRVRNEWSWWGGQRRMPL